MDEAECVLAEASLEFEASVVRLGCHLNEGFTHEKACTDRKVRGRDIEVDEKIVAENRKRLTVGRKTRGCRSWATGNQPTTAQWMSVGRMHPDPA